MSRKVKNEKTQTFAVKLERLLNTGSVQCEGTRVNNRLLSSRFRWDLITVRIRVFFLTRFCVVRSASVFGAPSAEETLTLCV